MAAHAEHLGRLPRQDLHRIFIRTQAHLQQEPIACRVPGRRRPSVGVRPDPTHAAKRGRPGLGMGSPGDARRSSCSTPRPPVLVRPHPQVIDY